MNEYKIIMWAIYVLLIMPFIESQFPNIINIINPYKNENKNA